MENTLAATIRAIGDDAFHSHIADYLKFCIDYDNIISMVWHGQNQPVVVHTDFQGPNVFRRLEQDYLSAAYQLDPFFDLHINHASPGIFRLLDIAPDNFSRSKYYKWYYHDLGITDEITIFCPLNETSTATISIGKSGLKDKVFPMKAEQSFKQQEPVLMALIDAHWAHHAPPAQQSDLDIPLSDMLAQSLIKTHNIKLSQRQAQVAVLTLQGHSSESTALTLGISPQTVKVFRKQLYKRCHISSQAELFSLMMPLLTASSS